MSSTPQNPISRSMQSVAFRAAPVLHPDYTYWSPIWETIRDAEIGEIEIKRKREKYLPRLQGHDENQYAAYLQRAVYYNMVAKTLNTLYGTMFKRNPNVTGLNPALKNSIKKFSKDGMSLHLTVKTAVKEVLAMGRYGMLVDADTEGRGNAYVACYTAENIIDWQLEEIEGEWVYTRVVLREVSYTRASKYSPYDFVSRFRVLVLSETDEGYMYEQHIYNDRDARGIPDIDSTPDDIVIPTVRGEPVNYIPFQIIGPFTNHPTVQKPPILDIVTLNLSHYQSYAQLEQGRFYTATPVYTVSTSGNDDDGPGEYYVGPDVVWELGKDGKAEILEYQGRGLQYLEGSLTQKEAQIFAIGGRMMPGGIGGAAESDNALKLKEHNEQTLLLNLSDTVDEGMTQVLNWYADWNNASITVRNSISFEMSRDFLLKDVGAREFRAIHQMYEAGVIPLDVLYEYLRKAEVIPDWIDRDEYGVLLTDAAQFPHMVDVLAKMKNFPDAKTFFDYKMQREEFARGATEVQPQARDPNRPAPRPQARLQ